MVSEVATAYGVWGSETSRTAAPSSRSRRIARSAARRTAGSRSCGKYSFGTPITKPWSDSGTVGRRRESRSSHVESLGSRPLITERTGAASCTLRPSTPIWSSEDPKATKPERLTRPYVGLMPTTPHRDAGWRTETPASEPSAAGTAPAATSAAEPPDEPPGTRVLSNGWSERPYAECAVAVPMPPSPQFFFPAIRAPAAFSFATAVASYGERYPSRIFEPQLVV